ncbi:MAG: CvpA family protein [Ruminococcaceae bacterium]|nr:CvpA family protein [Oscillospiraceae bacterium]
MSVIIDLIIVAIVVLFAVKHYRLGLACSLLSFGKFVLAFILAGALRVPLAQLLARLFGSDDEANALLGILAYVVIFAAVVAISGAVINKLKKIKIPIITKFDKLLGLALGLVIGLFAVSFISTAIFTVVEFASSITQNKEIMDIYSSSVVFKFIKEISLFEFVRSNI